MRVLAVIFLCLLLQACPGNTRPPQSVDEAIHASEIACVTAVNTITTQLSVGNLTVKTADKLVAKVDLVKNSLDTAQSVYSACGAGQPGLVDVNGIILDMCNLKNPEQILSTVNTALFLILQEKQ